MERSPQSVYSAVVRKNLWEYALFFFGLDPTKPGIVINFSWIIWSERNWYVMLIWGLLQRWKPVVKISQVAKARENGREPLVIVFTFASDWLRHRHELFGPIIELTKGKPMDCKIISETWLKINEKSLIWLIKKSLVRRIVLDNTYG